jgi:drug/metabolite transporter (DMT)-like permease
MTGQPPGTALQEAAPASTTATGGNPSRGVGLMLGSTLLFAAMHASIRHLSGDLHPFEIAFFRNLFGLLPLLPWILRWGLALLRTDRLSLHLVRTAFNLMAMLSFFYALSITPLSEVTALGFSAPIFTTVLAVLVLGEVVGIRRWGAIALGFLGTLIILRPGFHEIGAGQLLTLFSSLAWACALMTIKTLSRTESSITITAYMGLLMVPASLVPAAFVWQWPAGAQWGWLLAIGLLGGAGQLCMTEALKQADTSVVMPIDFCKLIWVAVIAYLAFGEVPGLYTWLGGAVIFSSTLYIAYREQIRVRAAAPPLRTPG